MDKHYNHLNHEATIYSLWEESGSFSPSKTGEPFTIIMPPPNANDPLHIGHAMFATLEDILIRYHRMKGRAALWLPGTDHAGIETQFVFEKKLAKEGKSRFQFDRDTLYNMIWDYVQQNSQVAVDQLKKIGASADWSRFTFMLEPKVISIVLDTFKKLYEDGLIYRAEKLVNYCTKCGTGFSELEVEREERNASIYRVRYVFTDTPTEFIEVETTRPETIFADIAIAIHPTHPKAKQWNGKRVQNPLKINGQPVNSDIKIIIDDAVDPHFGTGAVKITPFHDHTDFEIWQRHAHELQTPWMVIGFDGKLNELTPEKVRGLKVLPARKLVVDELLGDALLAVKPHAHSVGVCYRCKTMIEPLPLAQFFLKVSPLTQKALQTLDAGEVSVYGAGHDKILHHWLENLKDWNISRQIVWGIRIPVWYEISRIPDAVITFVDPHGTRHHGQLGALLTIHSLGDIRAGLTSITAPVDASFVVSSKSPGDNYLQETDTFDTWFSSAQWPYTTLMTSQPNDFNRFYPTDVMETGYDILPFWVMRMLMMGIYKTGKAPFKNVYLHGLVRDEKGQKMSKSKGNVINPLTVVSEYGADALRMALVMSTTAGKDSNTGSTKVRGMRNFTNKMWNAARFIILNKDTLPKNPGEHDDQFREKLTSIVSAVSVHIDSFRIGMAAETLYGEFWHWYCDQVIEQAKNGLISFQALVDGLVVFLKLLHPFTPFITEAIYTKLKDNHLLQSPTLLIQEKWPNSA